MPRLNTAVATKVTVCLVLSNSDYSEQVYYTEHKKKLQRLEFLKHLDIFKSWNHERTSDFNLLVKQVNVNVGQFIYKIGDAPDFLYIVQAGVLSIMTCISWSDENKYPTGLGMWEVIITKNEVQYELHRLQHGDIFGHQELIEQFQRDKDGEMNPELKLKPPV